ncbi:hypothetical protein S83_058884, partial [Arachis hypogaea]
PQSGLPLKHWIDVGAGVIDADYRGPVGVILFNQSTISGTLNFSFSGKQKPASQFPWLHPGNWKVL